MNKFKENWEFVTIFLHNFFIFIINLIKSVSKSSFWFLLTLFFGLLQSWIILGEGYLVNNIPFDDEFENLFMNGALLFFSTAIISSLTLDYFLLRRVEYSKPVTGIMFVLFPTIVLILCISLFLIIHNLEPNSIKFDTVLNLELGLLTVTGIYAIIVKIMLELKLKNLNGE